MSFSFLEFCGFELCCFKFCCYRGRRRSRRRRRPRYEVYDLSPQRSLPVILCQSVIDPFYISPAPRLPLPQPLLHLSTPRLLDLEPDFIEPPILLKHIEPLAPLIPERESIVYPFLIPQPSLVQLLPALHRPDPIFLEPLPPLLPSSIAEDCHHHHHHYPPAQPPNIFTIPFLGRPPNIDNRRFDRRWVENHNSNNRVNCHPDNRRSNTSTDDHRSYDRTDNRRFDDHRTHTDNRNQSNNTVVTTVTDNSIHFNPTQTDVNVNVDIQIPININITNITNITKITKITNPTPPNTNHSRPSSNTPTNLARDPVNANPDPNPEDEMVGYGRERWLRDADLEDILHATIGHLLGSDWFSRNSDLRLGSKVSGGHFDRFCPKKMRANGVTWGYRQNLAVQLANSLVSIHTAVAQVHPKVIDSGPDTGHFPRDFEIPRRIDWFGQLDNTALDRILSAYDISSRNYSDPFGFRERLRGISWYMNGSRDRDDTFLDRLLILLEFLGVSGQELNRLADRDRDRDRDRERVGSGLGLGLGRREVDRERDREIIRRLGRGLTGSGLLRDPREDVGSGLFRSGIISSRLRPDE
ncbi:hypothetical protein EG329_004949 [Mollisiaceae sp. DMI_Dod_QoI]|nr:hypothetical protein EG329_004949 [Helotiales sp. DMI_Dod_QoI]